ncbi:hypothetical protein LOK49_Contig160G00002 [Camellia lanceoleosa]|nr:hypothetical protein LOK49_Contig160G00002 [Camellia lanceoleosa]
MSCREMVYEENEFQNRKTVSVPTGDSGGFQRWLDLPARARSSGGATTRAIAGGPLTENATHACSSSSSSSALGLPPPHQIR